MSSALRAQISTKAAELVRLPGFLAAEPGYRIRKGKLTDDPVISVIVERKLPPGELPPSDDLGGLLGPQNVDVVEANPLQALFAQPERYGVDPETLKTIEDKVGSPFSAEAMGPRELVEALTAAPRRATAGVAGIPDHISYKPPPDGRLEPVSGRIRLRCHASPDCGWRELKKFIKKVDHELVVGMYELTAPHIGDLLAQHLGDKRATFQLTLDEGQDIGGSGMKANDRREEAHLRLFREALRDRLTPAYALTTGRQQTFDTDYHIKLAVRDGRAFWLSSGSWQSSNQPPLDPLGADAGSELLEKCNREWHVIVEHRGLATALRRFLEWDLTTAQRVGPSTDAVPIRALVNMPDVFVSAVPPPAVYRKFFEPKDFEFDAGPEARVLPLLTPDNFIEAITHEIESARDKLYVQNQSLAFLQKQDDQDPRYTKFTRILAEKSHSIRDFRLILRDPQEFFNSREAALTTYRQKGFKADHIRFQPKCHNKGVLVDGQVLLLGSHNLTNAGTTANRDASLVVQNRDVVAYYEKIFLHDWDAADTAPSRRRARLAVPGEMAPPGMHRVPFSEAFDFD